MRRVLMVGCGGMGGAAVAHTMAELRSALAAHGVDEMPAAWQFVHCDMPTVSLSEDRRAPTVQEQGGGYFGCSGSRAPQYRTLLASVVERLADPTAVRSWAPRDPTSVYVPLDNGAGQFRALGRTAYLARLAAARDTFAAAWARLGQMRGFPVPKLGPMSGAPPIVLVISSAAGGAGAGMVVDICRTLISVGADPACTAMFLLNADVFDGLPPTARTGMAPNALALFGEVLAAQLGGDRNHDTDLMHALGLPADGPAGPPFGKVFHVGRRWSDGSQFGDGDHRTVTRYLGSGVARLMMNTGLFDAFVHHHLLPVVSVPSDRDLLGWGSDPAQAGWSALGFASLTMGRDRYAEYAAHRIARSCVEQLLRGHVQSDDPTPAGEQVKVLLERQWVLACRRAGLPDKSEDVALWIRDYILPTVPMEARSVIRNAVEPHLPDPTGIGGTQLMDAMRHRLAALAPRMRATADEAAVRLVFHWHRQLTDNLDREVALTVARCGLPYSIAMVERLSAHVRHILAPAASMLGHSVEGTAVSEQLQSNLAQVKGGVTNGYQVREALLLGLQNNVAGYIFGRAAGLISALVSDFSVEVLGPMVEALTGVQRELEWACDASPPDLGPGTFWSDHCRAWPSDDDTRVDERFSECPNEVTLTSSERFAEHYHVHLRSAYPSSAAEDDDPPLDEVRRNVVRAVVAGEWETLGGERPPGGMITRTRQWRPRAFVIDPTSGDPLTPASAGYQVSVKPKDLLERARMFVRRPGESFDNFCGVSIDDMVAGPDVAEEERAARLQEVADKFSRALALASPLVGVDRRALQAVHGTNLQCRFRFSEVPHCLGTAFAQALHAPTTLDPANVPELSAALGYSRGITRIDILGEHPRYSPLVFGSVLGRIATDWEGTCDRGRENWWRWRRSRPLSAALPMGEAERRAMVAGWILGLLIGRISLPEQPFNRPVRIWDERSSDWVPFPHPLLTPPTRFYSQYDLLPAVLESVLLAMVNTGRTPVMSSLRPYRLLRELGDDSSQAPQGLSTDLAAKALLDYWLDGEQPGPLRSAVSQVAADTLRADRVRFARDWLAAVGELGDVAMTTHDLLRDVAPDLSVAVAQLMHLLDELT